MLQSLAGLPSEEIDGSKLEHSTKMEGSGDSFEYLLQLMKTLSAQSWSTRQQTEKVEQTLKRLAKQNQISFTENCKPPDEEAIKSLEELGGQTEEDLLVDENYRLMYQIQQQEYIHSKICLLIQQVNEMIASIKNFVVEQKNITPGLEHDFLQRNVNMPATTLSDSEHTCLLYTSRCV